MISKNLYVLTPQEQQQLALVDTTLAQAWQIYDRNMPLLEALYSDEEYEGEVGCPHCCAGFHCLKHDCKWLAVHNKVDAFDFPCCKQTFGEVGLHGGMMSVSYGWADQSTFAPRYAHTFNRTETFLLGHIEWAQRLISGDMPVVEEPATTT